MPFLDPFQHHLLEPNILEGRPLTTSPQTLQNHSGCVEKRNRCPGVGLENPVENNQSGAERSQLVKLTSSTPCRRQPVGWSPSCRKNIRELDLKNPGAKVVVGAGWGMGWRGSHLAVSRMRQGRLEIGNPGQEYCVLLVMVVRLEHKLIPVVRLQAVLEQIVNPSVA